MSSDHGGQLRAGLGGRSASWALSLAALGGAFYPLLLPPSYTVLLTGFASVPGAAAAAAAVVGVAAAVAVWTAPRSIWPLVALAAGDAVLRAPGPVTAVALYLVAVHKRRPAIVAVVAGMTILSVIPRPGLEWGSTFGSAVLFVWLPLALGAWAAAHFQVLAGLRERADRLEREQSALAAQARAEEKTRIARDMHDVVAHRVSLIVLRAGALEVGAPDKATADEAQLLRRTGQEALLQLRHVLGALSPMEESAPNRPLPTLSDLADLVDQSRSAGVPVELVARGVGRRDRMDPGNAIEEHAAYRVVQEALTNVHKHAGGAATRVAVHRESDAIEVTVENAPPDRTPLALPGAGVGLIGLRERVRTLGGDFRAEPTARGGYCVWARLPT